MSAWSQAVWIVKKLENKINFQTDVDTYTAALNTLNGRVNELNNRVNQAQVKSITIIAKDNGNNMPNTTQSYGENAIWLVI